MKAITFQHEVETQKKIESILKENELKYIKTIHKLDECSVEYDIQGTGDVQLGVSIMAAGASTFTP